MSHFSVRNIEDMVAVGAVDTRSVRLWVRTTRPGPHEVELTSTTGQHVGSIVLAPPAGADGTTSFVIPDDVPGAAALTPSTTYLYAVRRGDHVLGHGHFETAPEPGAMPEQFSIAVMSCHQPFQDHGDLHTPSLQTLAALEAAFRVHDVKRVLLMGDQMYADYPQDLSLFDTRYFSEVAPRGRETIFDCTREEVRTIYQRRYRAFWSVEAFRQILASYPCQAVPDDHEIRDNYGSAHEHSSQRWDAIRGGALDAFDDYQGLLGAVRTEPRRVSFDYTMRYGDVGVYALDVRSQRRADEAAVYPCTDAQFIALERYLSGEAASLQVLLLVLSVPLVIYPSWVAAIGTRVQGPDSDAADRWSHPLATESRRRLTKLLYEHQCRNPEQRVVLVGGDIHIGCAVKITWRDKTVRPIYQLVSSSVSNLTDALSRRLATFAPHLDKHLTGDADDLWETVELLPGRDDDHNPFDGLNVGIVGFRRGPDGRLAVSLELVSHDEVASGTPRVVFATKNEL